MRAEGGYVELNGYEARGPLEKQERTGEQAVRQLQDMFNQHSETMPMAAILEHLHTVAQGDPEGCAKLGELIQEGLGSYNWAVVFETGDDAAENRKKMAEWVRGKIEEDVNRDHPEGRVVYRVVNEVKQAQGREWTLIVRGLDKLFA